MGYAKSLSMVNVKSTTAHTRTTGPRLKPVIIMRNTTNAAMGRNAISAMILKFVPSFPNKDVPNKAASLDTFTNYAIISIWAFALMLIFVNSNTSLGNFVGITCTGTAKKEISARTIIPKYLQIKTSKTRKYCIKNWQEGLSKSLFAKSAMSSGIKSISVGKDWR